MQQFGKYEIYERLGSGGMAIVYRARDLFLGRDVALKVIGQHLKGDIVEQRFLHEARVVAGMTHPNVVLIFDLGVHDGSPYIAMEYLPGCDLRDLIERKHPLTVDQRVDLLLQVGSALGHAHSNGIVHRDVKPANIRVMADGRAKLMDFGIAKLTGSGASKLTQTGTVLGSLSYMSPEQVRGLEVGPASDQFSFGVVLYELLTGRVPFPGDMATSLFRISFEPPDTFSDEEIEWLSEPLRRLILRCLKKKPDERFASFDALLDDLVTLRRRGQLTGSGLSEIPVQWIPEGQEPVEPVPRERSHSFSTLERLVTSAEVPTEALPVEPEIAQGGEPFHPYPTPAIEFGDQTTARMGQRRWLGWAASLLLAAGGLAAVTFYGLQREPAPPLPVETPATPGLGLAPTIAPESASQAGTTDATPAAGGPAPVPSAPPRSTAPDRIAAQHANAPQASPAERAPRDEGASAVRPILADATPIPTRVPVPEAAPSPIPPPPNEDRSAEELRRQAEAARLAELESQRRLAESAQHVAKAQQLEAEADYQLALEQLEPVFSGGGTPSPDVVALRQRLQAAQQRVNEALQSCRAQLDQGDLGAARVALTKLSPREQERPEVQELLNRMRLRLQSDKQPPDVQMVEPDFKSELPLEFGLRVIDTSGVALVLFHSKCKGEDDFREEHLEPDETGHYLLSIPVNRHGGKPVEYYIEAVDLAGNKRSVGSAKKPIKVKSRVSISIVGPPG